MAQDTAPATAPAVAPTPAAGEPASTRIAEHKYLAEDGSVTKEIESAVGISYLDKETKETFSFVIPGATVGSVQTMFAIFGAKTRCTNAASAARQKRERDATYTQTDVQYVATVFGETQDGQWSPEGEGARTPSYDLEVLADVVKELSERDSGRAQDRTKILDKLKADIKWRRGAVGNHEVKLRYLQAMAAKIPAKGAASLALD